MLISDRKVTLSFRLMQLISNLQSLISNYNFARDAKTTTLAPIIAINRNEARKVAKPAIKPITGGPTRKPTKPTVDTAASATPADMVFDLPAALYTIGTTDDTPTPTSRNPAIAV